MPLFVEHRVVDRSWTTLVDGGGAASTSPAGRVCPPGLTVASF